MLFRGVALALIALLSNSLSAQFDLLVVTNNNVSTWKIKNTDTVAHKITSVSLRFFHQKPGIIFTPAITFPGGGKFQFKGNFNGSAGYAFKYKTIHIIGLDTLLPAGGQAIASITTNEGDYKDTILAAGVKVYYTDNSVSKSADAFPAGLSTCPTEAVFINAGSGNSGIKLGSSAAQNLHASVCETQLVAIAFDNKTLLRKPVGNHIPHCAAGRKWTTFGNATDYQVYYTFNITQATGRLQFDSFVNDLNTGDYLALTNTAMVSMQCYDSIANSLKKIGYAPIRMGDTTGYISIIGKKGANEGEASYNYCKDPHGTCYISMEQSLTQNDVSATIIDFSSCYEPMQQVLEKTTTNGATSVVKHNLQAYPNPTKNGWTLANIEPGFAYTIRNAQGTIVQACNRSASPFVSAENLQAGIYFITVSHLNYQSSLRIMKLE